MRSLAVLLACLVAVVAAQHDEVQEFETAARALVVDLPYDGALRIGVEAADVTYAVVAMKNTLQKLDTRLMELVDWVKIENDGDSSVEGVWFVKNKRGVITQLQAFVSTLDGRPVVVAVDTETFTVTQTKHAPDPRPFTAHFQFYEPQRGRIHVAYPKREKDGGVYWMQLDHDTLDFDPYSTVRLIDLPAHAGEIGAVTSQLHPNGKGFFVVIDTESGSAIDHTLTFFTLPNIKHKYTYTLSKSVAGSELSWVVLFGVNALVTGSATSPNLVVWTLSDGAATHTSVETNGFLVDWIEADESHSAVFVSLHKPPTDDEADPDVEWEEYEKYAARLIRLDVSDPLNPKKTHESYGMGKSMFAQPFVWVDNVGATLYSTYVEANEYDGVNVGVTQHRTVRCE